MRKTLGYRDAVMLLGGDPPALAALDRALAGALSVASGGVSDAVLNVFDAQGRIIRLGRDLVIGLRDRLSGADRVNRMQRLEAAHTVIVVAAYFESLANASLPFPLSDLKFDRQQQITLADDGIPVQDFLDSLLATAPPRPAPHLPSERLPEALGQWYKQLSARLLMLIHRLAEWKTLDFSERTATEHAIGDILCGAAVIRYQELYSRLALEVPEFRLWSGQIEHQATRTEVRQALGGIEKLLASLPLGSSNNECARVLCNAYRAALQRPILADEETQTDVHLPTLNEGYLDPDFRVSAVEIGELPSNEDWWNQVPVRTDLTEYLAGALTLPEATTAPLVVLGQPGAGKSVLTKVLAARLPEKEFVPVRVALREVPADAEVQDQIEYAVRAATGLRLEWSAVTRAENGAIPVVLLDGFDELLQATGVSQSDYLLKVARFQQREADLGHPVVALITSRIAVADRVRYPEGTVVLRLEPFREEQIRRWVDIWNLHNGEYLDSRGLAPLSASVVAQHRTLACEPLLLMMLALYDADANALQHSVGTDGHALDEARLYEELLTSFAAREITKSHVAATADEMASHIEQELQRLSLIAFGMINRHRQWVTQTELDNDFAALLGRRAEVPTGFRAPLTPAGVAVGRFFFVQRAQAIRDGGHLQTYEFLHATFGEYLAARLTVQLTADLLTRRPVLSVGHATLDDDLLYAVLSFAPLSSRQILRYVRDICARQVREADRRQLAHLLVGVFADSQVRTEHRYASYTPTPATTTSRHGIYGGNIVLLILALASNMTAAQLFPEAKDPAGIWHRQTLLWRSSLNEQDWSDLALALAIRHTWTEAERDLEVRLSSDPKDPPEPIDPYWHYGYAPSHPSRGSVIWRRQYWAEINHKMDIVAGTNDSIVRHAVEPLFDKLGPSITTFLGLGDEPATSVAHALVDLWLSRTLNPDGDPTTAYERLAILFDARLLWDTRTQCHAVRLVLGMLQFDASRLRPADITRYLNGALALSENDKQIRILILRSAQAAIPVTSDSSQKAQLLKIAEKCQDPSSKP